MKPAGAVLLVLFLGMPFLLSGQQSGSMQSGLKKLPPVVSGQQSGSKKLPLAITDKQAVEEWSRAIYDGPLDPKVLGDTAFLLSLNEIEWLGRFRYRQRCAICHEIQATGARPLGPLLTRNNVVGREDYVRERIMEGSNRMPGFKYSIERETVAAIITYLKKVERVQFGPGTEVE
jgi:hypothetical protein